MAGAFPGIDPYIESGANWLDFHTSFLTYWRDLIADALPDHYGVSIDERIRMVETVDLTYKDYLPDVAIAIGGRPPERRGGEGGVATLEAVAVPFPRLVLEEIVERYLQIVRFPDQSLVTVLELLSPTNKEGAGYWEYVAKRSAFLQQGVHLVELDLLLGGKHPPMGSALPAGDCFAFVSRGDGGRITDVYSWGLRDPLPTLPIPLQVPDRDIGYDLAALYQYTYERGRYARKLDYDKPPDVPLRADDRQWVEERVRTWKEAARPA